MEIRDSFMEIRIRSQKKVGCYRVHVVFEMSRNLFRGQQLGLSRILSICIVFFFVTVGFRV